MSSSEWLRTIETHRPEREIQNPKYQAPDTLKIQIPNAQSGFGISSLVVSICLGFGA